MSKRCISICLPPNSIFYNPLIARYGKTGPKSVCLLDIDDGSPRIEKVFEECSESKRYVPVIKNIINSYFVLKYIYEIDNVDDLINWMDNNKNLTKYTYYRILNCAWETFYDEMILKLEDIIKIYYNITKIPKSQLKEIIKEIAKKVKQGYNEYHQELENYLSS